MISIITRHHIYVLMDQWQCPDVFDHFVHMNNMLKGHNRRHTNNIYVRSGIRKVCIKELSNDTWNSIQIQYIPRNMHTVFALLCFVVVIHWLIFPYPSGLLHWHCGNRASKATLMNMDKYFMWIQFERLHNHNKAKHNKTVCIFLGIYCTCRDVTVHWYLQTETLKWNYWWCKTSKCSANVVCSDTGLDEINHFFWMQLLIRNFRKKSNCHQRLAVL